MAAAAVVGAAEIAAARDREAVDAPAYNEPTARTAMVDGQDEERTLSMSYTLRTTLTRIFALRLTVLHDALLAYAGWPLGDEKGGGGEPRAPGYDGKHGVVGLWSL